MKSFTVSDVQRKYGIHPRVVTSMVKEGFVVPMRGKRREYRFSFQDVVLLRKAHELNQAGISTKKTASFLRKLSREHTAGTIPRLSLSAAGRDLVVREEDGLVNSAGQLVLDFALPENLDNVARLVNARYNSLGPNFSAEGWFSAALLLEDSEPLRAIEYYHRALEIDQKFTDAYVNLSCLLIEQKQHMEALAVCEEAVAQCPDSAILHFNFGVLHEEMERYPEALNCYTEALELDPGLADAHYNLARLHETNGRPEAAIRHYKEYRKLER